jgi:hypothetical protein
MLLVADRHSHIPILTLPPRAYEMATAGEEAAVIAQEFVTSL